MTGARDAVVTGIGFCLPGGAGAPVLTADDAWAAMSTGRTCLSTTDGLWFGGVRMTPELFSDRLPEVPGVFADHFTRVHRFGLISLVEACVDAKLDFRAGALADAAILAGRGSIDANVPAYRAVADVDPDAVELAAAMDLFVGGELSATPADVALVQAAVTRSTGPALTVAAGCASSAMQLSTARLMIAAGEVDVAVVTGADSFSLDVIRRSRRLMEVLRRAELPAGTPELPPSFDGLMRPYDERAGSINFGEGSATLVLESREHAERRGAHVHGTVLAQSIARDGLAHPLASDDAGTGLVTAIRRCLGDRWSTTDIPYVHGGSDGDATVTAFEAAAVRALWGEDSGLLLSSHEGCFGHDGAPAGTLGVALTLLMMQRGQVCPTTNCEQPADLPFDPVPGAATRPLSFDLALSLSYQIGGVKTAILLGSPEGA